MAEPKKTSKGVNKPKTTVVSEADILKHLKKADPLLHKAALPHRGQVLARVQPKRSNNELFRSLASSIVSQQLSTKAAASIFARVILAVGGKLTAVNVLETPEAALRAAGLSAAKVKSLKELSGVIVSGELNLLKLRSLPADEAVIKLSSIWGIGPWTAEMFLIFALGSPDVFSSGDLILVRMLESLHGLPKGSKKPDLERLAATWAPFRSYGSLLLWRLNDNKK
ncbi:MAG: HhH-GPD family protein DNA-3-methyladenine glycosylase [Parcubacteria group bacterium]|nr:HhH-GPD family protein DNA-3-methyladenine glycosylase [Parcubacteria group bacterium]